MNNPKIREIADNLMRELSDRGQIIEGGWRAYELLTGLKDAPAIQRHECRKAWYLGAQHLFASILSFLEPGTEETPTDMERMDKLDAELKRFMQEMLAEHEKDKSK